MLTSYYFFVELVEGMVRDPIRVCLALVTVGWGAGVLVVLLGLGKGFESSVISSFSDYEKNLTEIWGGYTVLPFDGLPTGRMIQLTNKDVELIRTFKEASVVAPVLQIDGYNKQISVNQGIKTFDSHVLGVSPEQVKVLPMEIVQGRYINILDVERKRKVAVLGEAVVEALFGKQFIPGESYINIRGANFLVVGVFRAKTTVNQHDRLTSIVYIPIYTAQSVFNYRDFVDWILMLPKDGILGVELLEKIRGVMVNKYRFAYDDWRGLGQHNSDENYRNLKSRHRNIKHFVWLIGVFSVSLGGFAVMSIMLTSVRKRRQEFAIRKVLGATPSHIIRFVLAESIVLTILGGMFGLVLGFGILLFGIDFINHWQTNSGFPQLNYGVPMEEMLFITLWSFGVVICVGLFSGITPAWKASKVVPAKIINLD